MIANAVDALKSGGIVIFPTDTVYGIGMLATDKNNPDELFQIKQRPPQKKIPLLVADKTSLDTYACSVPKYAYLLSTKYWPGALTLVLKAGTAVPLQFVADDGSIALRMPNNAIALSLIAASSAPLATSSANISGEAAVTDISDLSPNLLKRVDAIVDVGRLPLATPSTIVSCLGSKAKVLRRGEVDINIDID
jgi:tRNA threonylcarbamoyl adenosine modification protein (Sua5/YciO/YrdC/YwlC family)